MSAIQVKNVPEDLHCALRERAAAEGVDLQDYVLRVLRRELAVPSQRQWLEQLRRQPVAAALPPAAEVLHAERADRDAGADRR